MTRRSRVAASLALVTAGAGASVGCTPAPTATVAHHGDPETLVVQGRLVDTVAATSSTSSTSSTTTTEPPATPVPPTTRVVPEEATSMSAPASSGPTVTPSTPPVTRSNASPGTGDLAACIRHYESGDGADPNLYQFEGPTWNLAFAAAKDQGLIPKGTLNAGASYASREVQDAAFVAWVNLGYLRSAWAAQRGRCF